MRKSGITCPNKSHPEYKELEKKFPKMVYTIWDQTDGYGIKRAPNGEPSILYQDLLDVFDGNEDKAMSAKVEIFTEKYRRINEKRQVEMDANGEPKLSIDGDWVHIGDMQVTVLTEQQVAARRMMAAERYNAAVEERSKNAEKLEEIDAARLEQIEKLENPAERAFRKDLMESEKYILDDIIAGLTSRVKSLRQYKELAVLERVRKLELEIQMYEELRELHENRRAILSFIDNINKETARAMETLKRAHAEYRENDGKFGLRNEQLVQLQSDFLGFYTPLIDKIQASLMYSGYFDDLSETERNRIADSIAKINTTFHTMKSMYARLLSRRVGELLIAYGDKVNSPTIRAYVDNNLNQTDQDISWWTTYLGSMSNGSDEALRVVHSIIANINNEKNRIVFKRMASFAMLAKEVKKSVGGWSHFYEVDEKGRPTAYLIRDRLFGVFKRDLDAFKKTLGPPPIGKPANEVKEYYKKLNAWLAEHAERRYTPEYYDLFNDLSEHARRERDSIQMKIAEIVNSITDKDGNVYLENLTNAEYGRLEGLYIMRASLGVTYDIDGEEKTGVDLEVAHEIQELNKKLQENLSRKTNVELFNKVMEEKRESLSPEKFAKWYLRNTRETYSEEFLKQLSSMEKRDYGKEYADLQAKKRELLSLARTNRSVQVDAARLSNGMKRRIALLDEQIADLLALQGTKKAERGAVNFSDIATISVTDRYLVDRDAAQQRELTNKGELDKWFYENHHFQNGKYVPNSYYTYMAPKDASQLVRVPSNAYSEIDPNSHFVNKDFRPEYGERYIPKMSKYSNEKRYNEVMSDPKNKAFHEMTAELMREAMDMIYYFNNGDAYKLPQISGTLWAYLKESNGIGKGIKEYFMDSLLVKSDDIGHVTDDQIVLRPDGTKVPFIPTHFVNELDNPATISKNLAGIVMNFYEMAVNFKLKKEALPVMDLIQQQLSQRELRKGGKKTQDTKVIKKLNQQLDMHFFGQKSTPFRIPLWAGKSLNVSKMLNSLRTQVTKTHLGMSLTGNLKNWATAEDLTLREMFGDRYFSRKEYGKAMVEFLRYSPTLVRDMGDYSRANKIQAMMNFNHVTRQANEAFDRLNYNRAARFALNHAYYGGMTMGDYVVKSRLAMAHYMAYKYIPGLGFMTKDQFVESQFAHDRKKGRKEFRKRATYSLWDAVDKDGLTLKYSDNAKFADGKVFYTENLTNKITNTIHFLANRVDGQVRDEDKAMVHSHALLSFFFMHKNFLIQLIDDRIARKAGWNYMTQDWDEAAYKTTLWKLVVEPFMYCVNSIKYLVGVRENKPVYKTLTSYERYNLRMTIADFIRVFGVYQLLLSLIKKWYEEDKDKWYRQFVMNLAARSAYEAENPYDPADVYRSIQTLTPAFSEIDNLASGVYYMFTAPDEEVKRGAYKGWKKWQQKGLKLTPFKNLYELKDPREKLKFLKGRLQGGSSGNNFWDNRVDDIFGTNAPEHKSYNDPNIERAVLRAREAKQQLKDSGELEKAKQKADETRRSLKRRSIKKP